MPNHITNILKCDADIVSSLTNGERLVDFSSVVPMPEGLSSIVCEGRAQSLAELLTGGTKLNPASDDLLGGLQLSNAISLLQGGAIQKFPTEEAFENFIAMLQCFRKCGYISWYDWSVSNWGTKWNAYEVEIIDGGVKFQTAWSAPHPVIAALAGKFPESEIHHQYADEDIGSNCGHIVYHGQSREDLLISDKVDFALTITGDDRKYYRSNPKTGIWEYYESAETEVTTAA